MKVTIAQRLARLEERAARTSATLPRLTPREIMTRLAEFCERAARGDAEAARRLDLVRQIFERVRQRIAREDSLKIEH